MVLPSPAKDEPTARAESRYDGLAAVCCGAVESYSAETFEAKTIARCVPPLAWME